MLSREKSAAVVTALAVVLVAGAALPAPSAAQAVPRSAHYVGEAGPGSGLVELTVKQRRVVDVKIDYRFWRCSGPGSSRQLMGWDLGVFSPGSPRLRVGGDGRFTYRNNSGGRTTFSRVALTGRFSAQGQRVSGTFRWHRRGITGRGAVECRSPLIRYRAGVSEHEFTGQTSQGVPVRAELKWTFDYLRWLPNKPPPYIEGVLTPTIGLLPAPPPFTSVLLTCADGRQQEQPIMARADPATGKLAAPPLKLGPGEQLVVSGRVSPLAAAAPASVSLAISATRANESGEGLCTGSATFEATELAPLVP